MPQFGRPIDLTNNELLNVLLQSLASDPSSPLAGRIYLNTTIHRPRMYTGSEWITLEPSTGGGDADTLNGEAGSYYLARGNHTGSQLAATISDLAATILAYKLNQFAAPDAAVSLNSQKITNLADPASAQDAATMAYVQAQIANLIASAPGALDTLNELAAALGNDADFATTVTNAITAAKDRANHTGTQLAATISDFATAADARQSAWGYAGTIGDGSTTSIAITHNLGTRDVDVTLYRNSSPYDTYFTDIERTSTNVVTALFTVAPTSNQFRALVRRVA